MTRSSNVVSWVYSKPMYFLNLLQAVHTHVCGRIGTGALTV
jgi:hypothetical protein